MPNTLKRLTIIATFLVPLCAEAQDAARLAQAAAALDMSEDQFMNCIPDNAVPGERLPQSERRAVLDCLKQANPSLSNSDIRSAMQGLRD